MLKTLSPFGFPVLLFLVLSSPALADWTELTSDEFTMAAPPEVGSAEEEEDYAELHRWQEERTKAECDEGYAQLNHSFGTLFGDELTEKELARLEDLMKRVFKLTSGLGSDFKEHFDRPRPYTADKSIKPCVPRLGKNRAYPSTHAALGTVGGCVLAKALPKKAAALRKHGKRIGELRVIVGLHHPTDVKAGQKLGRDLCNVLLKDDEFLAELIP